MSMMRPDFGELQLDAKLIDSSKVIKGYIYLSEEIIEEKELQERKNRRVRVLFLLLLVSTILYLWKNPLPIQWSTPEDSYHHTPTLIDVLADGVVEHLPPETPKAVKQADLELGAAVPKDIVQFIDAKLPEPEKPDTAKVVLAEVKVPAKNAIDINKVMASGDRLFARDRLMSPPEHNAFARYEKVLSIQPNHPKALAGIKKIVDRYVYLAETVIAKKETYKVPDLIQRAYQAGEKYMDVSVLITQFSEYLTDDSIFITLPTNTAAGETGEKSSKKSQTTTSSGEVKSEDQLSSYIEYNQHDSVFIADKKISETAYDLYSQRKVEPAIKVLENFTQLSGFWGESNDLLLKMYLAEKKVAQAENLIYSSKALDAYQFAEKAARVMMTRGDSQGALDMLTAYRPEFSHNRPYYTLMASLQHKVGQFDESVYWYRKLLNDNFQNPRLWLGLAVSLDALDEKEEALQAFEYVRLYSQQRSAVRDYINEHQLALAE